MTFRELLSVFRHAVRFQLRVLTLPFRLSVLAAAGCTVALIRLLKRLLQECLDLVVELKFHQTKLFVWMSGGICKTVDLKQCKQRILVTNQAVVSNSTVSSLVGNRSSGFRLSSTSSHLHCSKSKNKRTSFVVRNCSEKGSLSSELVWLEDDLLDIGNSRRITNTISSLNNPSSRNFLQQYFKRKVAEVEMSFLDRSSSKISASSEDAYRCSTTFRPEATQFWMEDSYGLNEGDRLRAAILAQNDDEFMLHRAELLNGHRLAISRTLLSDAIERDMLIEACDFFRTPEMSLDHFILGEEATRSFPISRSLDEGKLLTFAPPRSPCGKDCQLSQSLPAKGMLLQTGDSSFLSKTTNSLNGNSVAMPSRCTCGRNLAFYCSTPSKSCSGNHGMVATGKYVSNAQGINKTFNRIPKNDSHTGLRDFPDDVWDWSDE